MHVILGLLGAIVAILVLLNRLTDGGIDIGWLNPFAWRRRRAWRKRYQANPVYTLDKPMEVTALLSVAVAKSDGDMSAEQKEGLRQLLANEFSVDDRKASALINSSAFLLRDGEEVRSNLQKVLEPSLDAFTPEQTVAAQNLLERVATLDGEMTPLQRELLDQVSTIWQPKQGPTSTWN